MDKSDIRNSDIFARFSLAAAGRKNVALTSEDWQELSLLIDKFCPDLGRMPMIIDPPLRTEERRLCLLMWLGFKPTEICVLLNLAPSHITMLRVRLHEKIFGCKGSAKDFDEKMKNLIL